MTTQIIQINPESFFDTNTTLQIIDISSIHHISTPSNPVITIQDDSSNNKIHIFFNVQIHETNTFVYLQIHQLDDSNHYAKHIHALHVLLSDTTLDTENNRNLHVFIIHNINLTRFSSITDKVFTSENIFKNKDKQINSVHYVLYYSSNIEYSTIENYIGEGKNVYEIIDVMDQDEDNNNNEYNYNHINISGRMHVLTNLYIFSENTSITINIDASMVIVHENMNRDQVELTFNIEQSTSIIIADLYSDFSNIAQDDAYMFFQIQENDIIEFGGSQSSAYYNTKNDWKDILLCILNPTSDPYYIPNNISDKVPRSEGQINVNDVYTCVYVLDHIDYKYTLRNIELFLPNDLDKRPEKDYIYGISGENISMEITENVLEKGSDRPAQYFEKREEFENDVVFIQIIRRYELLSDRVYIDDINNREYMDIIIPKDYYFVTIMNQSFLFHKDYTIFEIIKDESDPSFVYIKTESLPSSPPQNVIRINIYDKDNIFHFYPMNIAGVSPKHIHILLDFSLSVTGFDIFPSIRDFSDQLIIYKESTFLNTTLRGNVCTIDISNTKNGYFIDGISDYKSLKKDSDGEIKIDLVNVFINKYLNNPLDIIKHI